VYGTNHFFALCPDDWVEFFDMAESEGWIESFALSLMDGQFVFSRQEV